MKARHGQHSNPDFYDWEPNTLYLSYPAIPWSGWLTLEAPYGEYCVLCLLFGLEESQLLHDEAWLVLEWEFHKPKSY